MQQWIDHVWTSLRSMPAETSAESLESAWLQHSNHKNPVTVIFGAYDSGKSSLLKRLLFEDACEVPPQLTISARRETFEVEDYQGADWIYRDSPGLAGGNEEHQEKALASLDLADLIVWVLPPQLVTSERDVFCKIASGEHFGTISSHVANSLIIVIAKMDEAGIDPADNPAGYFEVCQRKVAELSSFLTSIGAMLPRWGVHPMSADPYQGVGNGIPDATIYAMGSTWDGLTQFRESMGEATQQAASLRVYSGVRFAARAIQTFDQAISSGLESCESNRRTCDNELDRFAHWLDALAALRGKCAADLRNAIEGELLSASRTRIENSKASILEGISNAVDRWCEAAHAEFHKLTASANQEACQRKTSPSLEQLRKFLHELTEPSPDTGENPNITRIQTLIPKVGKTLPKVFQAYAEFKLGMSLEEVSKKLDPVLKSGESYKDFVQKNDKIFDNEEFAEQACKIVKTHRAISSFGPLLGELNDLVGGIGGEILAASEAEKRRKRSEEIRGKLRERASEVEEDVLQWFDKMTAGFSDSISRQQQGNSLSRSLTLAEQEALESCRTRLQALIQSMPG